MCCFDISDKGDNNDRKNDKKLQRPITTKTINVWKYDHLEWYDHDRRIR